MDMVTGDISTALDLRDARVERLAVDRERRRIREAVAALGPHPGESEPTIGERWWASRQTTILAIVDGKA